MYTFFQSFRVQWMVEADHRAAVQEKHRAFVSEVYTVEVEVHIIHTTQDQIMEEA